MGGVESIPDGAPKLSYGIANMFNNLGNELKKNLDKKKAIKLLEEKMETDRENFSEQDLNLYFELIDADYYGKYKLYWINVFKKSKGLEYSEDMYQEMIDMQDILFRNKVLDIARKISGFDF